MIKDKQFLPNAEGQPFKMNSGNNKFYSISTKEDDSIMTVIKNQLHNFDKELYSSRKSYEGRRKASINNIKPKGKMLGFRKSVQGMFLLN